MDNLELGFTVHILHSFLDMLTQTKRHKWVISFKDEENSKTGLSGAKFTCVCFLFPEYWPLMILPPTDISEGGLCVCVCANLFTYFT